MKRYKIVIANWKMNLTVPESTVLLEKYKKDINPKDTEVVICPSFMDIYSAEKVLQGSNIKVGAQDVYHEDSGAYTGEVSADQLRGFAEYCIVGHSERRNKFGETDKIVSRKAAACIRHEITPIICVGENLHEKMDGLTKLVVTGQTEASLSEMTAEEVAESVIAYEPVWSIGTGHICDPKKANEVAINIRNLVKVLFGAKTAEKVKIVYGGSVDDKNAKGYMNESDLDGFLIGGASLDYKKFSKIIKIVDEGIIKTTKNKKQITKKPQKTNPKKRLIGKSNKKVGSKKRKGK